MLESTLDEQLSSDEGERKKMKTQAPEKELD